MQADGKAWLFAPAGLTDGPLPAHYEPEESPFRNLFYGQQHNPVRQIIRHPENRYQPSGDQPGSEVFPYVTTTYRLTEHHTAGGMSRFLPYLSELQPAFFCEVSPQLAAERALEHLGWATVITARSAIEARVLVTERIRPLCVQGRTLHQVGLPWHWGPNGCTAGDAANELAHLALDPNVHIQEVKAMACDIRPGGAPGEPPCSRSCGPTSSGLASPPRPERRCEMDAQSADLSSGQAAPGPDPAALAGYPDHPPRMGFFTGTSVCIGCKACEVACKEWNDVPEDGIALTGMSYDNTGGLSASTWRHVAFIEEPPAEGGHDVRWLMSSDVCKHCTEAACLDVCPTGALMRTEFGTVVVQDDVCNGCGYCVSACPFGVIARRESDGGAHKCTLCYDRIGDGLTPACAKACPTESIQFGPLDELRERAQLRVTELHDAGRQEAQLYLADPDDGIGGGGAFFLLPDQPEVYGLPPDPVVTTRDLPR